MVSLFTEFLVQGIWFSIPAILQVSAHGNWVSCNLILTLHRVNVDTAGRGPTYKNAHASDAMEVSGAQSAKFLSELGVLTTWGQ